MLWSTAAAAAAVVVLVVGICAVDVIGCSRCYALVQAYHPKFCQPRMPHAIATRMSRIWYHADRQDQWKRVT